MNPHELQRYGRHIVLREVGAEGQEKLLHSRVLIVGLGGLGSPIAMYLAASGIGHLVIVDYDVVDLSNLQRQIVHVTANIGRDKAASAAEMLRALNPDITITALNANLQDQELREQVRLADAVVDATDNFATRFTLNRYCVEFKKPFISGAVVRLEGQVTVFDPRLPDSPCYRCLYKEMDEIGESCARIGVLAPVPGIIGTVQATETLKILLGIGPTLAGRLVILDARAMEWREIALPRDPACPVCG